MPALDFRDDVRSLLTAMTRPGVLREADRENLLQILREQENRLVANVQRIILEWLERLGSAGDFKAALKKGTADTASYLATATPNRRLFLLNAVTQAMNEIIAPASKRPLQEH